MIGSAPSAGALELAKAPNQVAGKLDARLEKLTAARGA